MYSGKTGGSVLVKGSAAAKDHMARLRAMRGKGKSGHVACRKAVRCKGKGKRGGSLTYSKTDQAEDDEDQAIWDSNLNSRSSLRDSLMGVEGWEAAIGFKQKELDDLLGWKVNLKHKFDRIPGYAKPKMSFEDYYRITQKLRGPSDSSIEELRKQIRSYRQYLDAKKTFKELTARAGTRAVKAMAGSDIADLVSEYL